MSKPSSRRKGKKVVEGDVSIAETIDETEKTIGQEEQREILPWSPIVTGKAGRVPIVFTQDRDFFFVAAGSTIRIYSTNTGRIISTLSSSSSSTIKNTTTNEGSTSTVSNTIQHTSTITGLSLNPSNVAQLISCSLDGTVKVWDFFDGKLIQTIRFNYPLTHLVTHSTLIDQVIVAARKPRNESEKEKEEGDKKNENGTETVVYKVHLRSTNKKKDVKRERIGKRATISDISITSDGRYLILVGHFKIHVTDLTNISNGMIKIITPKALTRVACHPTNNTFATGHIGGQIRLWFFLASDDDQAFNQMASAGTRNEMIAPSTLLHWHSHAVSALRFNDNGAVLLSGGEESTLVLWQLSTQGREYVPRLGGSSIVSISTLYGSKGNDQPDQFITAMEDGSVVFISTINMKPLRILQGVLAGSSFQLRKNIPSTKRSNELPLSVEPRTNNLVLSSGHPSTLQFLDTINDDQVMQLEVVPSNRVSRPGKDPLTQPQVEIVCFSYDQNWMATVDAKATGECTLKIWQWNRKLKEYELNTRIDQPHGPNCDVISMCFGPETHELSKKRIKTVEDAPLLITQGDEKEGKCRSWRCVKRKVKQKTEVFWYARSIFDYRDLHAKSIAWSLDGSLLAILFGTNVTIWEPESNALVHVFSLSSQQGTQESQNAFLTFAGKAGRFVVVWNGGYLTVFDMVLGRFMDSIELSGNVKGLFPIASNEGDLTVISSEKQNGQVRTFSLDTVNPITLCKTAHLPFGIRQVINTDLSEGDLSLYAITDSFDVVIIGKEEEQRPKQQEKNANVLKRMNVRRRTIFDELLGSNEKLNNKATNVIAQQQKEIEINSSTEASKLFDSPSHLLPPPHLLFEPFMKLMLPARKNDVEGGDNDDEEEEEEGESDEEEEMEVDADLTITSNSIPHVQNADLTTTSSRLNRLADFNMDSIIEMFSNLETVKDVNITGKKVNGTTPIVQMNGTGVNKTPSPGKKNKVTTKKVESNGNGNGIHSDSIPTTTMIGDEIKNSPISKRKRKSIDA